MKKIYLEPTTDVIALTNIEGILAFSNQIDNANPTDDHNDSALEGGGEGSGGDDMGAKGFNGDWTFYSAWDTSWE